MQLLLWVVFLTAVAAGEDPTTPLPGVQDLTPDTFDQVVNGRVHALVEFYAPWCGHCKSLTSEYKKLGEAVTSDPKMKRRVVIAKVNADEYRDLGSRFGVRGFPTLKWFGRGQPVASPDDYQGGRTLDAFLSFIEGKLEADKGFGRVEILDPIVRPFLTGKNHHKIELLSRSLGDKDAIIKEVEQKVEDMTGDDKANGGIYIKLMHKTKEKGDDYLQKEKDRVQRIIDTGSVHEDKVTELSKKISIITAFLSDEKT